MNIVKNINDVVNIENNTLILGDCLEVMPKIKEHSVDFILCDLPYGRTKNKWDTIIPFDKLWENYERILKENGVVALFADGLFMAELMGSN